MTTIDKTALGPLDAAEKLLNPVLKEKTTKAGRFGFRGILVLKEMEKTADEKRPPEIYVDQVLTVAKEGEATIPFFAGWFLSYEHVKLFEQVAGSALSPDGKYFLYCNNLPLDVKFQLKLGAATVYVLPIDEGTVYNEVLELLDIEKNDLKGLDTAGKLDVIADSAAKYKKTLKEFSYEDGLKVMGPIKNHAEFRPV